PLDGLQPFSELMRLCLISVLLAKKELISGELIFFVTVDSSGSVVETSLLATPNEQISNLALRFAQDIKFKSAVCGGKPCKMEYPFRFRFDSR
ncbi:energy transducer TonB, partial [Undibacterium luofuense]|uniref:energy transducer TonB n=1 Tax=Undibacterium luofuense TaxID=2828733 RepID=UPI0030EB5CC2